MYIYSQIKIVMIVVIIEFSGQIDSLEIILRYKWHVRIVQLNWYHSHIINHVKWTHIYNQQPAKWAKNKDTMITITTFFFSSVGVIAPWKPSTSIKKHSGRFGWTGPLNRHTRPTACCWRLFTSYIVTCCQWFLFALWYMEACEILYCYGNVVKIRSHISIVDLPHTSSVPLIIKCKPINQRSERTRSFRLIKP